MVQRLEREARQEKISIEGVPETMLQTLYARAKESQKQPHYIYDEKAIEIVSGLDYDFSAADKDALMSKGVLARTILLDKMVGEWLSANSGTVVVNIACGLDTRCYRMAGKYVRWYNLDLPETIEVRQRFLPEDGPIYQISRSAMDGGWASEIEQSTEPVLVIIEGLTMYLEQADVQRIFWIIGKRFAHATVFVETMAPFVVKHIKEKSIEGSKAKFTWGIEDGESLAALLFGFSSARDVSLVEGMKVFAPVYNVLGKIGPLRELSNKILVLKK